MRVWILGLLLLGGCASNIHVEDLLNDDAIGSHVELVGQVTPSEIQRCTLMACNEDDPCCNTCSGYPVIASSAGELQIKHTDINCKGNNCGVSCSGVDADREYRFSGTVQKERNRYVLDVDEYIVNDE